MFQGGSDAVYYLRNYVVSMIIAIVCCTPLVMKIYDWIRKSKVAETLLIMGLIVLSVAYLVDSTYNPFLYFNF